MCGEGCYVKKSGRIIILPPLIKLRNTEKRWSKDHWSNIKRVISQLLRQLFALIFIMKGVVKNDRSFLWEDGSRFYLDQAKLSSNEIGLVDYQSYLGFGYVMMGKK